MNNNRIIASIYQIIETIEYFEAEQLFLVQNINNNNQYWLQHIDLKNRSDSDIELIKQKINTIKNLPDNERYAKLIEVKDEDNTINLVYEQVAGISLAKNVDSYNSNNEEDIIKTIKYALESLKIIHDHGFVHQMINPKNMLMDTEKDHLVINSYGKITQDLYSALVATISVEDTVYITQEQLRGQASFSSDIYALGIVIVNSIMGINILALDENDAGLLNWNKDNNYSDKFKNIINRMINSKINQRYSDVNEALADIVQSFPTTTSNNNVPNRSNYTPTEIILPETETKPKREQISSAEPVLNPTQISLPDESLPQDEAVSVNMAATELVTPSEEKIREDNLSKDDSNIINQNTRPEMNFTSADIDRTSASLNQPLDKTTNEPSGQQSQLLLKTQLILQSPWVSFLKTPKGFLSVFILILVTVIGVNLSKNYLEQKKVEQLTTKIEQFYNNNEFDNCIALINSTETQALLIADQITKQFLGKCWLGLAQLEASKGNFAQAIDLAVKINYKSVDYAHARTIVDDWSEKLLKEAQVICEKGGNMSSAQIKLASIPESSKWKKNALDLITRCQQKQNSDSIIQICPGPLCPK